MKKKRRLYRKTFRVRLGGKRIAEIKESKDKDQTCEEIRQELISQGYDKRIEVYYT